ncbi:MAG: hypothetical protein ACE5IK_09335 [Acidobacteriota bacterium]
MTGRTGRAGRRLVLAGLVACLISCDEGTIPDVMTDPGTGTQQVTLVQSTVAPGVGDAVQFQVTVTSNGMPASGVGVTFTTENPPLTDPNEQFQPVTAQTGVTGLVSTTLSTLATTPTSFDVRATASGGGFDVLRVTLQP